MQQIKTGDVIQNFRILSPSDDVEMIALHDTPIFCAKNVAGTEE